MPAVNYTRSEVNLQLPKWKLIRDCLAGQESVKAGQTTYLPMPNSTDTSPENKARYKAYIERAVFYNVTKRTLDGLVGQVFMRDPVMQLPAAIEMLEDDVDGSGVGLNQQAKMTLAHVTAFGRAGLLVDYPPTDAPATKAELDAGYIRPTITLYDPWTVINWRTHTVGARRVFSLVVLAENYGAVDDGFEVQQKPQWRVLRLDPVALTYSVEIWRLEDTGGAPGSGNEKWFIHQMYQPKDASGAALKEIPFTFVGAVNNDPSVDHAPLYDLAALNVAHYRNSADYEESCFITGQPTPFFAGLTQQWVDDVLKGQVQLGSRAAVPLPAGGSAGLLQAQANSLPKEAMDHKERQMVALGAKLVEQKTVQRTAAEAKADEAGEAAALTTIAKNVSEAYEACLTWAAEFMAPGGGEVQYELSTDYPAARMNSEERKQLLAEWQGSAITFTEMRDALRKAGVATLDDEEAKAEIDASRPALNLDPPPGENPPPGNKPANPDDPNVDPNAKPKPPATE